MTNIILSYKYTPRTEVVYINYLISNLNTYTSKTPVLGFNTLFIYPFINKKPYYNSGLFLNESINLINIDL